jgi:hypothetical protein
VAGVVFHAASGLDAGAVASNDPTWDHAAPPAADLEFDQRLTW